MSLTYATESDSQSFPCIICGQSLARVVFFGDWEAQPSDGVMCTTGGNYGSAVFDPFDGERLHFNICDPCLVKAGQQGRVMTRRHYRLIRFSGGHQAFPVVVGRERLDRPYIPWRADLAADDDTADMDLDELAALPAHCELSVPLEQIRLMAGDAGAIEAIEEPPGGDR